MKRTTVQIEGMAIPLYSLNTIVIGSGAASLNAAVMLHSLGVRDIAIVTEQWGGGTSYNSGSDKQTYYKLSLAGGEPDSPLRMAEDLYNGKCMHGDIALCEAVNSPRVFFHLIGLGVPFPHDGYGAYPGYKTDHDPRARATSAGPLTSRLMVEALRRAADEREITVLDYHQVVALLARDEGDGRRAVGALAIDRNKLEAHNFGFVLFNAVNVVLGTGGPGGLYESTVYPEGQPGSTGMAFEIGAVGQNLGESQFGIASTAIRWNLSGAYQQVIPRYISTDRGGGDEREFLNDFFPDMGRLASAIFRKGYQWPFDPEKIANHGSSLIDLLVHRERAAKGRRVFLDFARNPSGAGESGRFSFDGLEREARCYLENSGALQDSPIERLRRMNAPAVDLFRSRGIDLSRDALEIAVCAQHNNGGLRGNIWWESNIEHLFPVGEVNGSHGVRRPGGSALNAGQVGGLRAAMFIAARYADSPPEENDFLSACAPRIREKLRFAARIINGSHLEEPGIQEARREIQARMTRAGAHIRDPRQIAGAVADAWRLYEGLKSRMRIAGSRQLGEAFRNLDLCLTHALYLEAIREYIERGGASRGSYMVLDPQGAKPCEELEDTWRYKLNEPGARVDAGILEIGLDDLGRVRKEWVDVKPIPPLESWFEEMWRRFREGKTIS